MTKEKTLELFQDLNKQLATAFERIQSLDNHQLIQKEGEEWSIMEIMEHLYKVEDRSLNYLLYKMEQGSDFKKVGMRQRYNVWIMQKAYNSNRKFTAPDGVKPDSSYKDVDELKTDFLAVRKRLYDFLNERTESEYRLAMYKTAFFGRISLYQMLVFFDGHFKRHMRQLERVLDSIQATA
jgi:hypothetical protein